MSLARCVNARVFAFAMAILAMTFFNVQPAISSIIPTPGIVPSDRYGTASTPRCEADSHVYNCPGAGQSWDQARPVFYSPKISLNAPPPGYGEYAGISLLGDFNNDDSLDIAALAGSRLTVTLYDQNQMAIASHSYTVANANASIVAADFNNDGKLDLAVVVNPSSGGGSITILPGNGDGTFGVQTSIPAGAFPFYLAAGDFNRDGNIDLAASSLPASASAPGTVEIFLGNGRGGFAAPVNYPVGKAPATIVTDDFNADGTLDIVVLDEQSDIASSVWVLPGNGDGTFRPAVSTPTGTTSGFLSYADLNHDGKLDLMIADMNSSTMLVMLGNGNGTFATPQSYTSAAQCASLSVVPLSDGSTNVVCLDSIDPVADFYTISPSGVVNDDPVETLGKSPVSVAAGDINGDSKPDLVVADSSTNSLYVQLSEGRGAFAAAATYPLASSPGPVALADLNGDGRADAIVSTAGGLMVLLGNSTGALSSAQNYGGQQLSSLTIFKDGGRFHALAASANGVVNAYRGNGDGTFQPPTQISFASGLTPVATAAADVNRDGHPDLIAALRPGDPTQPGVIAVALGNGDGTFQSPAMIPVGYPLLAQSISNLSVTGMSAGDLNADGVPDIAVAVTVNFAGNLAILLGKGDGTFGAPTLTPIATAPPQIVLTDLNGDGKLDAVMTDCCGLAEASFLLGNGDGTFQAEVHFPSGPNPVGIAAADFSGDGKMDLAIAGQNQTTSTGTLTLSFDTYFNTLAPAPTAGSSVTIFSAATGQQPALAPGSLATAQGTDLATTTLNFTGSAWPPTSSGTSVTIQDAGGNITQAPLLYISPGQVNFYVPASVATGAATITIASGDGATSKATVQVSAVAPGIFELNSSHLAAAVGILVSASGAQTPFNVYAVDSSNTIVANPINLGSATDEAVIELYGTGIQAAGTNNVTVTVNGAPVQVLYAGPSSDQGEDQINVVLPYSLTGAGNVTIQLTAAGKAANPVQLAIQ